MKRHELATGSLLFYIIVEGANPRFKILCCADNYYIHHTH